MAQVKKSENVPKVMQEKYKAIVEITDRFSKENLNEDYAQLILYAVAALCRSKVVRTMLGMYQLDPNWSLSSRLQSNPLVWMLSVNGLMVDVRSMPREIQEIAFEKGYIPYIPDDRE